jgi:membrane protease YdiL (CAAX protease family)
VFVRGVLLSWLRKRLNIHGAIFIMAALFALMHGSLVVAPYVFIFAVVAGYVRVRTGSTFNTIIMPSLNNFMLLIHRAQDLQWSLIRRLNQFRIGTAKR